jgi:hypothetical protein
MTLVVSKRKKSKSDENDLFSTSKIEADAKLWRAQMRLRENVHSIGIERRNVFTRPRPHAAVVAQNLL